MQLKLVTFYKATCSVTTRFIKLSPEVTIEYRSLMTREFSSPEYNVPSAVSSDTVALIIQNDLECDLPVIEIDRHQGAYLLNDAQTVEIINTPSDFDDLQIWVKCDDSCWEKESVREFVDDMRYRRAGYEYLAITDGSDPNEQK